MKKLIRLIPLLALPLILWGCAPPLPDVVWPPPPDEPRIKYIASYAGAADIKGASVAKGILLGAETGFDLVKPQGVHVDREGRIFVTDTAYGDIFIFDTKRKKVTSVGAMGTRIFFKPIDVATDSKGRIFISDSRTDTVAVLSKDGAHIQNLRSETPLKQPSGLAVDENAGRLYVVDTYTHDIKVFDLETLGYVKTLGKRGKEEGSFNFPSYIEVDRESKLYVVDTMNARIQIFDREGKFLRSFGQFGDAPGMFARPKGIDVDSEGHIYVVDAAFNNVQVFDQEGNLLLVFSNYGEGRGELILPSGLDIDDEDFIYVVDSWNERINVYEYLGEKSKARVKK